jgi:hypothetical protein
MSKHVVLLGADTSTAVAIPGGDLVRKQILPRNKNFRWPNQPGKVLSITDQTITEVVKNFRDGVMDAVPFFKVNDKNQHVEDPEAARGKIVDLIETPDGLDALISVPDEATRDFVVKSGLGASAGMDTQFKTRDTGINLGAVLRHVAWTPEPWISGMRPFEQVSLSNETFEAVYLSADVDDVHDDKSPEGGEHNMDPKEIQKAIADGIAAATADLSAKVEAMSTANGTLSEQVTSLTAALNDRSTGENATAIKAELSAMVDAGLPPAIADIAEPVLMHGSTEVTLSSGSTSSVSAQVREMLNLIPKVSFKEVGESGVPEGHVVLSAEQAKALGFKVDPTKKEGDDTDANLSAEEKADSDAIAAVSKFLPQPVKN